MRHFVFGVRRVMECCLGPVLGILGLIALCFLGSLLSFEAANQVMVCNQSEFRLVEFDSDGYLDGIIYEDDSQIKIESKYQGQAYSVRGVMCHELPGYLVVEVLFFDQDETVAMTVVKGLDDQYRFVGKY